MQFRRWLWHARLLESLTIQQLEEYACLGRLPDPLPEPLPRGKGKLEMDRKGLKRLWEDDLRLLRFLGGRSKVCAIRTNECLKHIDYEMFRSDHGGSNN